MADDGAPFLSNRDVLLEIRQDVANLHKKFDRLNEFGSIGTKAELADHETRIRSMEKWRWSFPLAGIIAAVGAVFGIGPHTT